MLMDAFVLACLSTVGLAFTYRKLPRKTRRWLEKYGLFTDFLTAVLTYFLLGGTLTALTAGVMVGIFTSALMYILANPDDFLYIWDLKRAMEIKLQELKRDLNEFGKQYRERQQGMVYDAHLTEPTE